MRKINIEGTANVVNLCIAHKIDKLCYVSSIASLGHPTKETEQITEKTPWNPEVNNSDYAISKYGAEIEVWRASQEGVKVIIVNPGIIIGPGFWNTGSGQIFTRIQNKLSYHFPKTTGFVGVMDVVKAMLALMQSPQFNESYILVSENVSFKTILDEVANSLDKPKPHKSLNKAMVRTGWIFQKIGSFFGGSQKINRSDIQGLFKHSYYDNSKIKASLKFTFSPISKVIKETAHYFQQDRASSHSS